MRVIAEGLGFPEGPVALSDGSVLLVEVARGTLVRVGGDGTREVVGHCGGGPNGAAVGPDGRIYVCNNGGLPWGEEPVDGPLMPDFDDPGEGHYSGGRIETVDPADGRVRELYRDCDGEPLSAPNDLVFDAEGGFYFTDLGVMRRRSLQRGAVFYARADGSAIREVVFPALTPNGIGLSPDGRTLYVAETLSTRLFCWDVESPGVLTNRRLLFSMPAEHAGRRGHAVFDSLAVEADGNVCVATPFGRGITVIAPTGELVEQVEVPAMLVTNICFGGEDLRTAFITAGAGRQLLEAPWPRPGLRLAYEA